MGEELKNKKQEWVDGENFNLESLVMGKELRSKRDFGKNSVEFRSLSSEQVEEISNKHDMIGFKANRAFNKELLAESIVEFNGKPLPGSSVEERMSFLAKLPDSIFDLLLSLHQEFRRRVQNIVTEDNIAVF